MDDLLSQDEGRVVGDAGVFDMALVDSHLTIVEEFGNGSQTGANGYLVWSQRFWRNVQRVVSDDVIPGS